MKHPKKVIMKTYKKLLSSFLFLLCAASALAIDFTVAYTGSPSELDVAGANKRVEDENARRAALDPPGTPLLLSTGAELKASYLEVLAADITRAHASKVLEANETSLAVAKAFWDTATEAERASAIVALGGP